MHDSNLVPYPLYWTQTVCDYTWASNDTRSFRFFTPNVDQILTSHASTANGNWLNVPLNFCKIDGEAFSRCVAPPSR